MSGDFKNSMLAVVRAIRHKPAYFAHTLVKAFGSIGKSASVIRVIVSRCESDMVQVKEAFQAEAQKPLGQAIVVRICHIHFNSYPIAVITLTF